MIENQVSNHGPTANGNGQHEFHGPLQINI